MDELKHRLQILARAVSGHPRIKRTHISSSGSHLASHRFLAIDGAKLTQGASAEDVRRRTCGNEVCVTGERGAAGTGGAKQEFILVEVGGRQYDFYAVR